MWRAQKCNFLVSAKTAPTGTGQQTIPCIAAPYWASNRNFQNFGDSYRYGSAFAPKECLYCKEATGVESPKMQFPGQCKNRSNHVGQQTTPCLAVPYGQKIEIFKISGIPIAMVACLHQCNVYIVRKLRGWKAQKCNFLVQKPHQSVRVNKLTRDM